MRKVVLLVLPWPGVTCDGPFEGHWGDSMTIRRSWSVMALAAASLLAAPPTQAQSLLRVAPETLSRILDPHFTTSFTTRDLGYLVYDTLFAVDDKFEPKPQMVESYTVSPDKLTYTFVLRPGLKWHDGQPVTAADCVASIRRWASRDSMGQMLTRFTASLEATDAGTIKLVLKEPYGMVLDSLAKVGAPVPFMMPERIARTPGSEQVKEIVGSGPYKFRADLHEPGVKIVLEKFADYKPRSEPPNWASGAKIAKLDRIEMLGMPDAQTQVSALIRGEVDYLERVPADLLPLLDAKSGAKAEVVSKLRLPGDHAHEPPAAAVRQHQGAPGGGAGDRPLDVCRRGGGRSELRHRLRRDLRLRHALRQQGRHSLARRRRRQGDAQGSGRRPVQAAGHAACRQRAGHRRPGQRHAPGAGRSRLQGRDAGDGLPDLRHAPAQHQAGERGRLEPRPHDQLRARPGQSAQQSLPGGRGPSRVRLGLADRSQDRGAAAEVRDGGGRGDAQGHRGRDPGPRLRAGALPAARRSSRRRRPGATTCRAC